MATPLLVLVIGLSSLPGLAHAGKPTKNTSASTSSITLNQSDPTLGHPVSFTVTYPSTVKSPRVAIWCYQSGTLGYMENGAADSVFDLGASSDWSRAGGAAECKAELYYYSYQGNQQAYHNLAWTYFDAAA